LPETGRYQFDQMLIRVTEIEAVPAAIGVDFALDGDALPD